MAFGGIVVPILTEYNDKGTKDAIKSLKGLAKSQLGASVSAATLIEFSRRSMQAAMEDAAAQKQLSIALTNSTGATMSQQGQIEKNVAAMQYQYAVADDQLRPALGNLTRTTGNLAESQTLLESSLNISAATGRDLESVSLAVAKAYNGNYKALRSMGLQISDSAIKSKDFAKVMSEVDAATAGAGEAFANTAQGGMQKLNIKFQDLQENIGNNLLTVLIPATDAIQKLGDTAETSGKKTGFWADLASSSFDWMKYQVPGLAQLSWLLSDNTTKTEELTTASAGLFRMYEQSGNKAYEFYKAQHKNTTQTDKANKAIDEHKKKLAELAKAAKEKAAATLLELTNVYQGLIDKADEYRTGIGETVNSWVSLSDAVQTATDSDQTYTDALKERADAYAELNKLQEERRRRGFDIGDPNVTYDANEYADALDRVSQAEKSVTDAQSKRVDYSKAFRDQISAAQEFAGNLQTLVQNGLQSPGLAQLLNLGPVAGNQVAKDMIAGIGGLTITDLNTSLSNLATAGNNLGLSSANQLFGQQIQQAGSNIKATGNTPAPTIYVTIQQTDPRAVVDALRDWNWINGGVPINIGTLI